MIMETEIVNNPPRTALAPAIPPPQTVQGTLEHTSLPTSDVFNITDLAPDFSWMTEMHAYVGEFEYKKTDAPSTNLYQFSANAADTAWHPAHTPNVQHYGLPHGHFMHWQTLPFFTSRWWSGEVCYKFLAIKPPRVTGKLIVRYAFHNDSFDEKKSLLDDSLLRGIKKEWDLGLTNEFDFDISGICPMQARPTWITETWAPAAALSPMVAPHQVPPSTYMMGKIYVQPAQFLQPGSIFPDSIRILVFRYFKNVSFRQLTDPAHIERHMLYTDQIRVPFKWEEVGEEMMDSDYYIDKYYHDLTKLSSSLTLGNSSRVG